MTEEPSIVKDLEVGAQGKLEWRVEEEHCTQRGNFKIFSTPNMVMLLEHASIEALRPFLNKDQISVGSRVEVQHMAPTLLGMKVNAIATVREIGGSRVLFEVDIFDEMDKVGNATHERYVLELNRYMKRLEKKKASLD